MDSVRKNAIITGGATGIGRAACVLFAKNGYNVIIGYNKSEIDALGLEKEICSSGGRAKAVKADVSVPEEAAGLVFACLDNFGTPDVLVNNAGIALPRNSSPKRRRTNSGGFSRSISSVRSTARAKSSRI